MFNGKGVSFSWKKQLFFKKTLIKHVYKTINLINYIYVFLKSIIISRFLHVNAAVHLKALKTPVKNLNMFHFYKPLSSFVCLQLGHTNGFAMCVYRCVHAFYMTNIVVQMNNWQSSIHMCCCVILCHRDAVCMTTCACVWMCKAGFYILAGRQKQQPWR